MKCNYWNSKGRHSFICVLIKQSLLYTFISKLKRLHIIDYLNKIKNVILLSAKNYAHIFCIFVTSAKSKHIFFFKQSMHFYRFDKIHYFIINLIWLTCLYPQSFVLSRVPECIPFVTPPVSILPYPSIYLDIPPLS